MLVGLYSGGLRLGERINLKISDRFATALRRICSKMELIFAIFKAFWDMPLSAQRKSTGI
jgi:hypothetical protein